MAKLLVLIFTFLMINFTQQQPTASDSCVIYNSSLSVCTQCLDGYYLQYFFCISCNPLCSCPGNGTYCESCINITYEQRTYMTYRSGDVCVLCNTTIPFCIQCSTDGLNLTCSKCVAGRYLITGGVCSNITCTQNCEICQNQSTCKNCSSGFYLDKKTKLCSTDNCVVNCSICQDQNYCRVCIVGYVAINGTCEACSVENCAICNDTETCLVCMPSYLPTNGTCFSTGISDCIEYTGGPESPTCLVCLPSFYNAEGSCTPCSQSGCLLCSQSFICQSQCLPGFKPFNYACIPSFELIFNKYYVLLGTCMLVLLLS